MRLRTPTLTLVLGLAVFEPDQAQCQDVGPADFDHSFLAELDLAVSGTVTNPRRFFRMGPPDLRAIARAMGLLPERPSAVHVFEAAKLEPATRSRLSSLDAFIVRGRSTVYVRNESRVLGRASAGSTFHVYVLASIIWHETAHLSGEDEPGARRAEIEIWQRFLLDNRLDRALGLAHLQALRQRLRLDGGSAPPQ